MDDMDPEDIKAAIRKKGRTLAGLGAQIGLTRQAMTRTITIPNARNEKIISRVIGKPACEIWPSRYHPNGARRKPQPSANYRSSYRFGNRSASA